MRGDELVNTGVTGDKHIQVWREAHLAFAGSTTSQQAYAGKGGRPASPSTMARRTSIPIQEDSRFHGETTSRSSYQAPPPGASDQWIVAEQKYEPSTAKFYASTTSGETYRHAPGSGPARPSEMAKAVNIRSGSDFYGETTNRSSFADPGRSQRVKGVAPGGQSLDGVLPSRGSAGDFGTTSRAAFVAHSVPPPEQVPRAQYEPNKAYFYGSTTSGEAYQAWAVPAPERAHAPAHRSQSGQFYGSTTAGDAYVQHPKAERQALCAPVGNLHVEGAFDGHTTSRDNFRGWQLPKQRQGLGLEMVNDKFFTMIAKNQSVPTEYSQVFTTVSDNQTRVEIVVRQGDSPLASENEVLASFELVNLPPGPVGSVQIDVIFRVNEAGVLHIDARDKQTGKAQHIAIDKTKNSAAFATPHFG